MGDRKNGFVSASELARLGYCERQVAFDAAFGRGATKAQEQAQERGLQAHATFFEESRRIAAASSRKGRCFVATLALGECRETSALRAFRDLFLRRSVPGRWLIGGYYKLSPGLCRWLEARPRALKSVSPILRGLGRCAEAAVHRKLR